MTRGEPIEIAAVSIDKEGRAAVEPLLKDLKIERLPVYLDPQAHAAKRVGDEGSSPFILYSVPVTYIIGRRGQIAGYLMGEADWTSPAGMALLRYYMAA
jgi:hypothetical protein